jgi:hypothetical protein
MRNSGVRHVDDFGPFLDADDRVSGFGEHRGQGQTDVAEADDPDVKLCWQTAHS